jgi:probable F420-dependent oxidoreductase
MRFALDIAPLGDLADPGTLVELAEAAESAGWDAVFIWDHLQGSAGWSVPIADPWVALSAIAARTRRIRLGPMVLALPRRRPWLVARAAATLDQLSGGRVILGVGLGYPPDAEFAPFGEDASLEGRAARLDEGLELVTRLWSGDPVTFAGNHHRLDEVTLLPRPVQVPRIPIWVATTWPRTAGLSRAARFDGVAPLKVGPDGIPLGFTPDEIRTLLAQLRERGGARGDRPYDVLVYGETDAASPADAARVRALEDAGATWWSEPINGWRGDRDALLARIRQGPVGA